MLARSATDRKHLVRFEKAGRLARQRTSLVSSLALIARVLLVSSATDFLDITLFHRVYAFVACVLVTAPAASSFIRTNFSEISAPKMDNRFSLRKAFTDGHVVISKAPALL